MAERVDDDNNNNNNNNTVLNRFVNGLSDYFDGFD